MFRVNPRDVPAKIAARRLGMTEAKFKVVLPSLTARAFPKLDPDTGLFDLVAIEKWCDARHAHLFGGTPVMQARDAGTVAPERIETLRRG